MAREDQWGNQYVNVSAGGQPGSSLLQYRVVSLNSDNAALILTGIRNVYGWELANTNAAVRYVKLYNKATAPTVGTDVPTLTLGVPGAGVRSAEKILPVSFPLGLGIGIVTGAADNSTAAVAAGEVIAHIFYK